MLLQEDIRLVVELSEGDVVGPGLSQGLGMGWAWGGCVAKYCKPRNIRELLNLANLATDNLAKLNLC